MMTNKLSFYIHIPFCVRKCDYCAFYSLAGQTEETKEAYFNALIQQISSFETDREISTIYFGGGTPPMLGVERICDLIKLFKSKFSLSENVEITVEVNPGTVNQKDLATLKKAGANRLSVGIQAANDEILKSIGRIHSFDQAKRCIFEAREAGFENISADIIFALPQQSFEDFTDGVKRIISLDVDHISAYSLQIEEGTKIYERRESLCFPDEDGEEAQYQALCEILSDAGFEHYEISSFAKNGFRSRHNMNYWMQGEYIGFGAAAHSFFEKKRFSAVCDVQKFIEMSKISVFAPTDFHSAEVISEEESAEERILLGLRTSEGVEIPESAFSVAERICQLGYGRFENGILSLNSKGFRVSNEIIAEIIL